MGSLGLKWVATVIIGLICWMIVWFSDHKIENATFLIVMVTVACSLGDNKK